jgi:predicted ATPase
MDIFERRCQDMQSYASRVISICKENAFSPRWASWGRILDGWTAICEGDADGGTAVLQKAIAGWQKEGARWMPMFLILEAEGHAKAGRDEAGLGAVEQALAICDDTGERWTLAEVLRTKASILLSTGRAKSDEIEGILLNSLEIARRQQALCWELRTSCDLARLWQDQGRNREALKLLQSVYDQFTEGFDAADLKDAKELLRCLKHKVRRKPSEHSTTRAA